MSEKHWNYSHGDANTRLLRIWHNMKNRCYYTKSNNYADYGAEVLQFAMIGKITIHRLKTGL